MLTRSSAAASARRRPATSRSTTTCTTWSHRSAHSKGPALARVAGCSVDGLAGVTRVGPARPAACCTQRSSPQHRVAPPQCCCALRPSCVRHTQQCAVVAVACCAVRPQMKACADKDLRVVTEGQKKPAMAKFQHLQHVSRGRGCSVKQRSSAPLARGGRRGHMMPVLTPLRWVACVCVPAGERAAEAEEPPRGLHPAGRPVSHCQVGCEPKSSQLLWQDHPQSHVHVQLSTNQACCADLTPSLPACAAVYGLLLPAAGCAPTPTARCRCCRSATRWLSCWR